MWIWISMGSAALSLYLLLWWFGRPYVTAGAAGRSPQALFVRVIWPWIDALAIFLQPLLSWHVRRRLERLLSQAGTPEPWTPSHVCAVQCIAVAATATVMIMLLHRSLSPSALAACLVLGALPTALWPVQRLRERIRKRKQAMLRELPFLLDMVTLAVEAGLNLHGALRQAAQNGPDGPLRDELHHMLSNMRTGASRQDALTQWAQRCDLPALHYFVAAVSQAEQSGMSLGPVLRAQADQRRSERFQRAEKLALEAPVKLLFPLVTCIFPCSFLIIGFPIAGKFMALLE